MSDRRKPSGDLAAIVVAYSFASISLLALIAIGGVQIDENWNRQNHYKSTREYCDAKLRSFGAHIPRERSAPEGQNKPDDWDNYCQQIRAAEAAEAQARWAQWQTMLSFGSLVLLFIATAFAFRAYRAAEKQADAAWKAVEHAKTGTEAAIAAVKVAHRTSERELSSEIHIVGVKMKLLDFAVRKDADKTIQLSIDLINIGRLPARNANVRVSIKIYLAMGLFPPTEQVSGEDKQTISFVAQTSEDIRPHPITMWFFDLASEVNRTFPEITYDKLSTECTITVMYDDAFTLEDRSGRSREVESVYIGHLTNGPMQLVPTMGRITT